MAAVVRAVVLDRPQPRGGGHPFGVRIRSDVGHHCPHLCRLLGEGDDPRHDAWRGATRLGEASSSRLVSRGEQGREMTQINVIQPGTIEAPPGEIPFLLLPERNTFQARATRLSTLAEGHALADYLRFLAALARAQHESLSLFRDVLLPEAQELERCREHGMPPLGTRGWNRDPVWREAVLWILTETEAGAPAEGARAANAPAQDTDEASLARVRDS